MDPSALLQPLLHLWYFIPLVLLLAILRSPWFKGHLVEFVVNASARLFVDKDRYHLVKNLTLPAESGATQFHRTIVFQHCAFVVQAKSMKGWIFGKAKQRCCPRKLFDYSQTIKTSLGQNYEHLKTLQNLLGLGDEQLQLLVAFEGDSTFKTEVPGNVTKGWKFIWSLKSRIRVVLRSDQVSHITEMFEGSQFKASLKTVLRAQGMRSRLWGVKVRRAVWWSVLTIRCGLRRNFDQSTLVTYRTR
ncbi:nuclease-related domain-containing protein [Marinobacter sp. GN3S48]|uniref:nuclease-related domain-containing protein n=1 Tax=Marinobacter sp. GN3S48 TaxID=3382302 RepID=UPI00387B8F1D